MVNQAPPVTRIPAYRGSCNIRLHQPQEALAALEETLEPLEPFNVDACCRRCGEIKERFLNGISHCSKSIFQHRRFVINACRWGPGNNCSLNPSTTGWSERMISCPSSLNETFTTR